MKRLLKIMILLLSLSALTACGADEPENDLPTGDGVVMTAVITEVGERLHVEVTESEYTSGVHIVITGEQTDFYGKDGERISRSALRVGDTVEIVYSGQVMMSYPPQIVARQITQR